MKTRNRHTNWLMIVLGVTFMFAAGSIWSATLCVNPAGSGGCFSSIQAAVNAASPGDTIRIQKGSYFENVVVDRSLTLQGEDQEDVVIYPAISNPNPCTGSSLCGGSASNIILVQADNVTIRNLTVDGDNPHLTSGIVRGGADLDARNGIIVNFNAGMYNNLLVDHVVARNIYLRGIYASSGGTFNFHDNEVRNVQGDEFSICMFNFGGSGVMANNEASDCNDALSSNWSAGVQFLNNEIKNSGSGIHTDNAGGFGVGTADLIQGNEIKNSMAGGYGIFVFVTYIPVTVRNNRISNVDVGLAAFGQGAGATVSFVGNSVDGMKKAASTGVYVTTDQLGFGQGNVSAAFNGNLVTHYTDGFIVQSNPGATLSLTGACNAILRNSNSGMTSSGSGVSNVSMNTSNINGNGVGVNNQNSTPLDAGKNWWGCKTGPGHPGCDSVLGTVNFSPILPQPSKCAPDGQGNDGGSKDN